MTLKHYIHKLSVFNSTRSQLMTDAVM